jgi:hypothetical protein
MPSVLFLFRINPENNPNIYISFMAKAISIQTCVINNGWISEIFKNNRGICQRCPLSALLFVISVEIMALRLRENKNMPSVLFLFRINPENNPNIYISFMAKAISVLELTNNVVSSAN